MRVDKPNPVFARMLQQAIGGPEGEMRVMNQYLFQAWGARGPKRYRDMLIHTGTEEIGHGEFSFADSAPALGQEPQLAKSPASVHGGTEATRGEADDGGEGVADKVKDAVGRAL